MRKLLSFLLFSAVAMSLSAQMQRGLKDSYILDSFPKVSFVWNTADMDEINHSRFALYEDGESVEFMVEALPVDEESAVKKNILFLWEDMADHNSQSYFTRELLSRFFSEVAVDSNNCFEVAVFDRQKDTEKSVLKPLVGQFTSDGQYLANVIMSYETNSRTYSAFPLQTDLYQAINEGIDMLPADRAGVIVVVTAGLNMKAVGASTEMETVRKKAFGTGVPIYVVKYPLAGNTPEVNLLSESTHGVVISSTTDIDVAVDNLKQNYHALNSRIQGRDYRFTFISKSEHDGKPHPLRLTVDKMRRPLPPFVAPKLNFFQWLVKNWWIAVIVVLVVASIVVLYISSAKKREKEREQSNLSMQEQLRHQQEESERRSLEMMDAMRSEQESRDRAAKEAAEQALLAAEEERLGKLMQTKNLFPRLQCQAGTEVFCYTIAKPRITMGREADNDVAFTMKNESFNNQTISGHHAEIVFNGSAFEVFNRSHSYTQGIIVNGQFYQQYTLRSGDMIGLGEAVVTFYV